MKTPKQLPAAIVEMLLPRLSDEFLAFYTYRAAANWCRDAGFIKAAEYFAAESADELVHAQKIETYLTDWNVLPKLPAIAKAPVDFEGLPDIIEQAYQMEYDLYESYEETSMDVFNAPDLCTFDFLQFFRAQQTKSVAEYADMLNKLDGVDLNSKYELLSLEKKLFG